MTNSMITHDNGDFIQIDHFIVDLNAINKISSKFDDFSDAVECFNKLATASIGSVVMYAVYITGKNTVQSKVIMERK